MSFNVGDYVYINLYDLKHTHPEYDDWSRYHGKKGKLCKRGGLLERGENNSLWLIQFEDPKGVRGFFERYFKRPTEGLE